MFLIAQQATTINSNLIIPDLSGKDLTMMLYWYYVQCQNEKALQANASFRNKRATQKPDAHISE